MAKAPVSDQAALNEVGNNDFDDNDKDDDATKDNNGDVMMLTGLSNAALLCSAA